MRCIAQYLITILLLSLPLAQVGAAEREVIKVVANIDDKSLSLSKQQIRNLFMGGTENYDLKVFVLPPNNITRVVFNTTVVGLTESRVQSYWAQMRFTGRKKPPREFGSTEALLTHISNTPGSVGYVSASTAIPDDLVVVYQGS